MAKMEKVEQMMGSIPEGGHLRSKSGLVKVEPLADGSVRWTSGRIVTVVDTRVAARRLAAYKDHALDAMVVVEAGDEVPPRDLGEYEVVSPVGPTAPEAEAEQHADDEAAETAAPEPEPEPAPVAEAPAPAPTADGALPPGVRMSRDGYVKISTNKPVMARWKADEAALNEGDGSTVSEILKRVPTTIEVRDESEYRALRESAEFSARSAIEEGAKSYAGAIQRIIGKLDATRDRLPAAETAAA